MSKKNIFIIGKSFSEYVTNVNKDLYDLYLLEDDTLQGKKYTDFKKIYRINFKNKDSFLKSIEQIEEKPDCILAMYENYIVAKSWLGEYYKLNIFNEEAAKAATNKYLMRQKFYEYDPNITPNFIKAESFENIIDFTHQYGFPIMIKPANLSKSLLIYKCLNLDEAKIAYSEISTKLSEVYKKYNIYDTSAEIVVEEYMKGTMHTVAAFMDLNGKVHTCHDIVDNITAGDIGKKDNYLYLRSIPTKLSNYQQKEVIEVAEKGMKALNLKGCAGHVEIFYTEKGPKLIEIGARLGGYRSRMYKLASGINLVDAEISASLNLDIAIEKIENKYCSVFEIFPDQEGKFTKITNYSEISKLQSYYSMKLNYAEGDLIGKAQDGYKFTLNIILSNSNLDLINKDIDYITNNIKVEIL